MSDRDEIISTLRAALPDLKLRWPIHSLALFGSMARGEATEASDVDLLVEFDKPIPFSIYFSLEQELERLTGRHVDLITPRALKPHMGKRILEEALLL
jgi:predicted nucleotidyltransferase